VASHKATRLAAVSTGRPKTPTAIKTPADVVFGSVVEPFPLDEIDMRLIDLLTVDGRLTNRALAAEVGLTDQTVAWRIRRLIDNGVMVIGPQFDWQAAGFHRQAIAFVRVSDKPLVAGEKIGMVPGIFLVDLTFGHADLVLLLLAADDQDMHRVVSEVASIHGVASLEVNHLASVLAYSRNYVTLPFNPTPVEDLPEPAIDLDDVDIGIVRCLTEDGRMSSREIARQLGISDQTVRSRKGQMEQAGLIRVGAKIDPYRSGQLGVSAFIGLLVTGDVDGLTRIVSAWPNVSLCATSTGPHNVIICAITATDREFHELVTQALWDLPGVRAVSVSETTRILLHRPDLVRIV
jgi:DNA-binding Lrp family transcriptional regulator